MENSYENYRMMEQARKKVQAMVGFYKHLAAYVIVNVMLFAIKWFTLDAGEAFFTYNTFSTTFFWGLGLAFHGVGVFGPNLFWGSNWEKRKIKEYMDKNKNMGNRWE